MKLIEPKAELLLQPEGLDGVYKQIELCGRTCYKSTDKITDESAKPFVERMIASKHTAMLEHGTVYLKSQSDIEDTNFWIVANSPYAKVVNDDISNITYITTNLRVVIELFPTTWHGFLNTYMCEPTEQHEKRYTIKFITDRGVSHELVRHRVFSFAQESTRYCNYSKDKFGGEITCINNPDGQLFPITYCLTDAYEYAEKAYFKLLENGCTPQQARQVLPNALKTEVCMTGFASDWRFFFDLRYYGETGKPHPDMEVVATMARSEFMKAGLWDDIMSYPSRFEHE
jgi:thymidylate synthase (FAD)